MNYFVGYLMRGEAAKWHITTTKAISRRFNTWKIYERLPPHVTVFYPFSTVDITSVKNILTDWARNHQHLGNFTIQNFDRFDEKVIFARVDAEEGAQEAVHDLRTQLLALPNMPQPEFPVWRPHATLINKVSAAEIERIWEYVLTLERPNFVLPFDNVTVFRYVDDRKWIVDSTVPIV